MSAALARNNVRVIGEGKTTLVLAHGFGTDQTAWRRQQEVLAARYRLVLFDHVGAAGVATASYSAQRYRSLHSYAADLREVLAALPFTQVIYIGHSMGAMVGLLAALEERERFSRMIFIGASPRYVNEPGYRGGFEQSDLDALYVAMASNYQAWVSGFVGHAMDNPERHELAAEMARTLGALRPDIALAAAKVIFQSDHRAELPLPESSDSADSEPARHGGAANGRGVHGEPDSAGPANRASCRGHLPHMSAPDAVNAAILSFLE